MLLAAVVAAATCSLVLCVTVPALRRYAVLDHPGERSSHAVPTPRGGGIGVAAGIVAGASAAGVSTSVLLCLAAVLVAGGIGLVEDVRGVPIRWRLCAHAAAGALVVGAARDGRDGAGWVVLGAVLAVLVVAIVNAVNFMDGINGISGVTGTAAGVAFALSGQESGAQAVVALGAATAAASLAFLPWNVPGARVFLGDVGSYALGAALAGCLVLSLAAGVPPEAALAPVSLYLADTGNVLLRRWRAGERLGAPHRQHVYQRLVDSGLSHTRVSALVLLCTAVVTVLAWVGQRGGLPLRVAADGLALAVLLAYLAAPARRRDRVTP